MSPSPPHAKKCIWGKTCFLYTEIAVIGLESKILQHLDSLEDVLKINIGI